ncbi:AMP-binding protein [Nostoc sp. FACHB-152]|uniref:AMP-binding protein n=1 Tax=unclassified Nostoc TaxID=2593658 RepID=UPI0016828DA8|nr:MULTISPECIES: AMP-binding protein [unclassified Nostoc]MBD2451016.1 AMP-binding protein [Nostoc sp. FACHB-152]MBD2472084.1 AMP-binding protein [Nostoc sp. FACHB-145]
MLNSPEGLVIQRLIINSIEKYADEIALLSPNRLPLTYLRLYSHIQDCISILNSMGLGQGDRIAIVLPNGPEMAVTFLAVATCATSAPLNPAYNQADFDFYLSDLNAKALIIHHADIDSPARAVASARNIPIIELIPQLEAEAGLFVLVGDTQLPKIDHVETNSEDIALVLHTSGTTSRPKIVPLTQANLCTSAQNISRSLQLTHSDRCLNVMPLFHIHGLIASVLSSLASGGSVVCAPSFNPNLFFNWIKEFQPTWYTAVPTIHQSVLAQFETHCSIAEQHSLRFIRSCSASLPPQLMEALEQTFHVPVIEAYGMTEASHQIASNPLPPSDRKARSVGIAAGPDVAIMDEVGNVLAPDELGEIVIKGANVTQGYENNPQANANAFTNGWFRTGDQGYLDHAGYLYITGRLKEQINRGGEKISPREIDEVLLDHPAIAQAVTFAVPHPTLGEHIAAAVVLNQNAIVNEQEIRTFAAARLIDFKVPSQIIFVKEIPKGPTGKLQRIGLAEKLASHLKTTFVAPKTDIEVKLASIWSEVLGLDTVGIHDNFFALGGDSLKAVQVLAKLHTTFGTDLPLSALFQTSTIHQLAEILKDPHQWSYPWYSLIPIQPAGTRPPLFGIHHNSYKDLPNYLGPDQPIYVLRYGLAAMKTSSTFTLPKRVEDLAAHYIQEIQAFQPEGPYFLMGTSFGGNIALEMAQQLLAQGQQVPLLILFDSRFKVGIVDASKRLQVKIQALLGHKEDQYTPAFYRAIGESGFFEPYHPKPYPGKVLFLKATDEDEIVERHRVLIYRYETLDTRWRKICPELDYIKVPGGHNSLLAEPHVSILAKKLKAALNELY